MSHTRINYPDKPNAQCDCDVGKDHWWNQVRYDEPGTCTANARKN